MQRPDVLVLGAGGTIGAAWMAGVLAGLADAGGLDVRAVEHLLGTSGGAMLAADVLAGLEPRAPSDPPAPVAPPPDAGEALDGGDAERSPLAGALRLAGSAAGAAATPFVPFALALSRPATSRVRAAALARVATPEASLGGLRARIAGHGLRFDGRLRVPCVARESGRRVIFGAPGAPPAEVAEAVQASCSVPWVYRAVRIGEREYVDGAVWSPTNLDAAPALRDTHVLCLAPTAAPLGDRARHPALRAATAAALALETAALRRRGAVVRVVAPPSEPVAGEHVRVTGYRQGLALGST